MARTFGAPETVPAGKPATQGVNHIVFLRQLALDIGNDMHDLAVIFEDELVGHLDRADLGDAAHIVAAEIEQHQMFGPLLGIGEKFRGERPILGRRGAAPAGSGDRPDRHLAVAHPDQNFGAGADHREIVEVEIVEERRRVDPPQGTVEGKGRQGEFRLKALRQHHLENIAGGDVVLGLQHHGLVVLGRGVGLWQRRWAARPRRAAPYGRAAGRAHRRSSESRSWARA